MRWTLPTILASFALAAAGCSPQAATPTPQPQQAAPTRHPISGLDVIPLTISQNGNSHSFRVEMARTEAEQEKGLMFRTGMGKDEGMLFPSAFPEARSFWMKNTVIPLDIVFIGTDHRIVDRNRDVACH